MLIDLDQLKGYLGIVGEADDARLQAALTAADKEIREAAGPDVSTSLEFACLLLAASKFNAARFGGTRPMPEMVSKILTKHSKP